MRRLSRLVPVLALTLSACLADDGGADGEADGEADSGSDTDSGTDSGGPDYPVELLEQDCPFEIPAERSAECYTMRLPLERAAPDAGVVEFPVAVLHPPSGTTPSRDPVVFLHGGPGGSAFARAEGWFARPLSEDGDVVIFDQRGSGGSVPNLDCPELEDGWYAVFEVSESPEAELAIMAAAVQACRDRLAAEVDLDAFDTPTLADDADDLRGALGIERWELYGGSYGTRLGLELMRRHGEHVSRVVLDSAYPPSLGDVAWMERSAIEALPRLIDGCLAEASCGAQFPNLEQNLVDAMATLDAEPYMVMAEDSMGVAHELALTGADMYAGLYNALYDPELIPSVPLLIAIAGMGGGFGFLDLLAEQALPLLVREAEGARFSIDCADTGRLVDEAELAASIAAHPELITTYIGYAVPFCALWDVEPVDAGYNEPVVSDLPTLIFAGEYDTVTPVWQSELTAETLSNSTLLLFPGQGHAPSFTNTCGRALAREFLATGAVAEPSCLADEPATTFP